MRIKEEDSGRKGALFDVSQAGLSLGNLGEGGITLCVKIKGERTD